MRRHPSLLIVLAFVLPGLAACTSALPLTGTDWRWTGSTEWGLPAPSGGAPVYTLRLSDDRTFTTAVECATVPGTYSIRYGGRADPNIRLVFMPRPTDLSGCAPGSQADAFITNVSRVVGYRIADRVLTLRLQDGSTLRFDAA